MTFRDELFTAMVRATLLEGKVYVVESNSQLVSVALWFHKPNTLFGRRVLSTTRGIKD